MIKSRMMRNCQVRFCEGEGMATYASLLDKKHFRSVEYKQSGWKLDKKTKKHLTFTDKNNIGRVKLVGSRDIYFYQPEQIKRVRLIRRADGYYVRAIRSSQS